MQTFIKIAVALVVLVLSLTGAAYLLPGSYHVERSVLIHAPAEIVFAQVNDMKHWQAWTIWREKDPEINYETSAASSGVGAWQRWSGPRAGRGEMSFTASEPARRVAYALHFPDYDSRSTGEITLEPAEAGVTVRWTNGGSLGWNPVMRWFGLVFDRTIGGDFEAGLARLKKTSEAEAALAPAPASPPPAPAAPEADVPAVVPAPPEPAAAAP